MIKIVQFVALLLTALSMGVHFGTWLTEGPLRRTQSGALFIEVHQGRDRVVARVMPILGSAALIFLALGVFLVRAVPAAFALSLAALVLCIGDMLVTVLVNVPINGKVQSWQPDAPPAEWTLLRDRWEKFHSIRALLVVLGALLYMSGTCALQPALAGLSPDLHSHEWDRDDEDDETLEIRQTAERRLEWRHPDLSKQDRESLLHVQILGINDFHGQIAAGRRVANRPVGGAAVLASYLVAAQTDVNDPYLSDRTFIVHAGDHVGASPPESALLQDEPSISFLNLLTNRYCRFNDRKDGSDGRRVWEEDDSRDDRRDRRLHPKCNLAGTPGNHEFDEGKDELLRLLNGGNHPTGPFLENPYRGARTSVSSMASRAPWSAASLSCRPSSSRKPMESGLPLSAQCSRRPRRS